MNGCFKRSGWRAHVPPDCHPGLRGQFAERTQLPDRSCLFRRDAWRAVLRFTTLIQSRRAWLPTRSRIRARSKSMAWHMTTGRSVWMRMPCATSSTLRWLTYRSQFMAAATIRFRWRPCWLAGTQPFSSIKWAPPSRISKRSAERLIGNNIGYIRFIDVLESRLNTSFRQLSLDLSFCAGLVNKADEQSRRDRVMVSIKHLTGKSASILFAHDFVI